MIWIKLYNKTRKIFQIDKKNTHTHTKYEGCLFILFYLDFEMQCTLCLSKGLDTISERVCFEIQFENLNC